MNDAYSACTGWGTGDLPSTAAPNAPSSTPPAKSPQYPQQRLHASSLGAISSSNDVLPCPPPPAPQNAAAFPLPHLAHLQPPNNGPWQSGPPITVPRGLSVPGLMGGVPPPGTVPNNPLPHQLPPPPPPPGHFLPGDPRGGHPPPPHTYITPPQGFNGMMGGYGQPMSPPTAAGQWRQHAGAPPHAGVPRGYAAPPHVVGVASGRASHPQRGGRGGRGLSPSNGGRGRGEFRGREAFSPRDTGRGRGGGYIGGGGAAGGFYKPSFVENPWKALLARGPPRGFSF